MKKSELRQIIKEELLNEVTPEDFIPKYRLVKLFPGMNQKKGTIFGRSKRWSSTSLITSNGTSDSGWNEEKYFKPFIPEFFKEIK